MQANQQHTYHQRQLAFGNSEPENRAYYSTYRGEAGRKQIEPAGRRTNRIDRSSNPAASFVTTAAGSQFWAWRKRKPVSSH